MSCRQLRSCRGVALGSHTSGSLLASCVVDSVMGQADTNKDGLLSLDEVRTWMGSVCSGDDDDFGWLRVLMTL